MLARVVDNDWIYLEHATLVAEPALVEYFSVRHPRAYFIDVGNRQWDGYFRYYDSKKQRLARPMLHELEKVCNEKNIPLEIHDERPVVTTPNPDLVTPDFLPGITLDQYQIDAIKTSASEEVGIYYIQTGGGKTEVMAGIAKLFNTLTVIIAEQRVVIEQIKERLQLRDIFDVGLFYGGETPSGQKIVVGSIQSLVTPPASYKLKNPSAYAKRLEHARDFQKIVKQADLLMVDECDRATNSNYRNLFKYFFNGRRKYGFSATPFDTLKPVENMELKNHLGSVIFQTDRRELERLKRIIPIKFYMMAIGENGDKEDKTAFDIAEREQMIDNTDFHQRILKIINAFPNESTLILVDTCNIVDLGNVLEKTIPGSVFIYGETAKGKRRKYLKMFEEKEIRCLIGGRILKRGLDLKGGVDNLIICGGGNLWSDYEQKIGRALRKNDKGWARVFAFMFLNNHYLYKHARSQLKAIVEMGYESKIVFRDITVDGADFVKSRFRKPKR